MSSPPPSSSPPPEKRDLCYPILTPEPYPNTHPVVDAAARAILWLPSDRAVRIAFPRFFAHFMLNMVGHVAIEMVRSACNGIIDLLSDEAQTAKVQRALDERRLEIVEYRIQIMGSVHPTLSRCTAAVEEVSQEALKRLPVREHYVEPLRERLAWLRRALEKAEEREGLVDSANQAALLITSADHLRERLSTASTLNTELTAQLTVATERSRLAALRREELAKRLQEISEELRR